MPHLPVLVVGWLCAAFLLLGLLIGQRVPRFRIWPERPAGSLASLAFWTAFRLLNVLVLGLCADRVAMAGANGDLSPFQTVMTATAGAAFALYGYALWGLGHDATYCRATGLNTTGIYRWSRNPQYATAIAAYVSLGLATASAAELLLAFALTIIFALMAIVEEPWLEAAYGAAYADYRASVPRFVAARKLWTELKIGMGSPLGTRTRGHWRP